MLYVGQIFQLMQVEPSGGTICNLCKWGHLVAKFGTNSPSPIRFTPPVIFINALFSRINQHKSAQSCAQIWKVANFMMESQHKMEFHNMMAFHHIMAVPYDGSRQFLNLVMFYWTFPQSFIFVIQSPELAQLTVREPGHAAFGPLSSHPSTGQENTSPVLIVTLIHSTYHA